MHFKQPSCVYFVRPGWATLDHVESNYTILIPRGFGSPPQMKNYQQAWLVQHATTHVWGKPAKPKKISTQCKICLGPSGIQRKTDGAHSGQHATRHWTLKQYSKPASTKDEPRSPFCWLSFCSGICSKQLHSQIYNAPSSETNFTSISVNVNVNVNDMNKVHIIQIALYEPLITTCDITSQEPHKKVDKLGFDCTHAISLSIKSQRFGPPYLHVRLFIQISTTDCAQ